MLVEKTSMSEEFYSVIYETLSQIIVGILIFVLIYMFVSKMDIFSLFI